jgi:IS1 family transposase/transposase-like protein
MGSFAVIVATCQHENRKKNGTTKAGTTRYRCKDCGKSWTESTDTLGGMRIGLDRAAKIIQLLCDGLTVSAVARAMDADPHTILDLLTHIGPKCQEYMQENIKGVFADSIQCDEIWQFVFCKRATAQREKYVGGCGDSFCFTAIDRHTKLLVAWHLGRREEKHCDQFIAKLEAATVGHFHISTDGFKSYPGKIKKYLGGRVDHGVIIKIFGRHLDHDFRTYSPSKIRDVVRIPMHGDTYQHDQICTSHVERMNGSIRNYVKRMGRLTYAFSKRWDNHRAALAVFFAVYNYCRKHKSLKGMTPAMAHGLTTEVWSVRKMLETVVGHT